MKSQKEKPPALTPPLAWAGTSRVSALFRVMECINSYGNSSGVWRTDPVSRWLSDTWYSAVPMIVKC